MTRRDLGRMVAVGSLVVALGAVLTACRSTAPSTSPKAEGSPAAVVRVDPAVVVVPHSGGPSAAPESLEASPRPFSEVTPSPAAPSPMPAPSAGPEVSPSPSPAGPPPAQVWEHPAPPSPSPTF